MLPETLELEVVTPERHVLQRSVHSIELPGLDGYLGILPGHAPLITELGIGVLNYVDGNETRYLTVVHGYAEALPDRVIVLAEISERAEEINLDRARAALERAQEHLAKPGGTEVDWDRATFALQRALVRVQAAAKGGAVGSAAEEHHTAP
jgi:F-type H+-transporting ATPase subunit epsilon